MVSELARGDWEELREQGLEPTLDDFDRLNQIALRLADGAETTAANFPRVGWAGDVPFFQPTYQAFAWYLTYCDRLSDSAERDAAWFYALAHCREIGAFKSLTDRTSIKDAVNAWIASLPVTADEIRRACRYAASGFDDAEAGQTDAEKAKTDEEKKNENLDALHRKLLAAAAASGVSPSELEAMTPASIREIERVAKEKNGERLCLDKSAIQKDYDLARRDIYRRLKNDSEERNANVAKEAANG